MASRLRTAAMGLLLSGSLAGCMSMPSGGPVRSFAVTAGPGGQSQQFIQTFPQPPQDGWTPKQIVTGFITASASLTDQQTAKEYLTSKFSKSWNPGWAANVYSSGPDVQLASILKVRGHQATTATVTVGGKLQATVANSSGSYAVASAKTPASPLPPFKLVQQAGQWRINSAPKLLLLTSSQFNFDYQQRNLYFYAPDSHVLVPDPVYVPNQASPAVLMKNLVGDLIHPPTDWLTSATATSFPRGTAVGVVSLDSGIATVSLNVAKTVKQSPGVWQQQVSSQLYWTLTGSGQGGPAVQSIELVVNGKPWIPLGAQQDPVQDQVPYSTPAKSKTGVFYYLDKAGWLMRQDGPAGAPKKIRLLGKQCSQIAVSPVIGAVQYVAALEGPQDTLYTGPLYPQDGKLVKRGIAYASMSWAPNGDLWATSGDQVYMLPGTVGSSHQEGAPVAVSVVNSPSNPGTFTWIRVAPDGVRVAIIVSGVYLDFGAIVKQVAPRPTHGILSQPDAHSTQTITKIVLSQSYVSAPPGTMFSMVTWYGPYNVITLGGPAPQLTEYPVNGGVSTSIPPPPQPPTQIQSVTASLGWPLIASVAKNEMMSNLSPAGAWTPIADLATTATNDLVQGTSPVYPG